MFRKVVFEFENLLILTIREIDGILKKGEKKFANNRGRTEKIKQNIEFFFLHRHKGNEKKEKVILKPLDPEWTFEKFLEKKKEESKEIEKDFFFEK